MARRRKKEEEHENLERWLVSYADFITLLFAFFVTMYAISRVDEQKLGSAVESLQRALGSLIPVIGAYRVVRGRGLAQAVARRNAAVLGAASGWAPAAVRDAERDRDVERGAIDAGLAAGDDPFHWRRHWSARGLAQSALAPRLRRCASAAGPRAPRLVPASTSKVRT